MMVLDGGSYVCSGCGFVMDDLMVFDDYAPSGRSADRHLYGSVVVGPIRLKNLQIALSHSAATAAVARARALLKLLKDQMGLGGAECEAVLTEFRRIAVKRSGSRGPVKRSALIVALAYSWVKEKGRRVNLRQVVTYLRSRGVRISLGDVMRALAYLREEGWLGGVSWLRLVEHYAAIAAYAYSVDYELLLEESLSTLQSIRKSVTGRSRENVAAAIVYVCLEKLGKRVPLYAFSRLVNLPVSSLRSNVLLVSSLLLEKGLEEAPGHSPEGRSAGDKAEEAPPVPVGDPTPLGAENDSR